MRVPTECLVGSEIPLLKQACLRQAWARGRVSAQALSNTPLPNAQGASQAPSRLLFSKKSADTRLFAIQRPVGLSYTITVRKGRELNFRIATTTAAAGAGSFQVDAVVTIGLFEVAL